MREKFGLCLETNLLVGHEIRLRTRTAERGVVL